MTQRNRHHMYVCDGCGQLKRAEAFGYDSSKTRGVATTCKACAKRELRSLKGWDDEVRCRICGAVIEDYETGQKNPPNACHQCKLKERFCKNEWCLCVGDPTGTRLWLGGHLTRGDLKMSLGSLPDGLVYEVWQHGDYVGRIRVEGQSDGTQELVELPNAGYAPKGDGRYLLP